MIEKKEKSMFSDTKIELLDSINILHNLANKSASNLPNEICLFISQEFNLRFSVILKEDEKNHFSFIGKSSSVDSYLTNSAISINNYDEIIESCNYENNFISSCSLALEKSPINLISFFFNVGEDNKYLLLLQHKSLPTDNEKSKYSSIAKFVQYHIELWSKTNRQNSPNSNIKSLDFLDKSSKGLVKSIKTINGLLTLIKEENLSNNIVNYFDEIKSLNGFLLESINDLTLLANIETSNITFHDTTFILSDVLEKVLNIIEAKESSIKFEFFENSNDEIIYDETILEFLFSNACYFISSITSSNHVSIKSIVTSENILRINIATDTVQLSKNKTEALFEPFGNIELPHKKSGLALSLFIKYIEILNGTYKLTEDINGLSLNIALPVKKTITNSIPDIFPEKAAELKDKILVIESDNASSSLLKNYLKKWNYHTEFVSNGTHALSLLEENKYVAVILNIEQENENSLILLQKIKNRRATRNTPVIVFSVEAEKEKIYLMGSVEYLVKPINYNNLVEILTSYKLRRNSTVLCVDDDKPTLSLVKQAVQTAGFNVLADHRPELVMDLINGKDLDLAIIDLDMPKLNGFDLINKIKSEKSFARLPIIIYTGKDDYHDDLQKIDGMFIDLLNKNSTSFNELENTITAMIKSYEEPNVIDEKVDDSTGPKILMAEDYKHSQIIVTRLLKKSGFENVIVVENGEEALNICQNSKVDLILMDMQMPVMNGFEATGKIRELEGYSDTPIIALTAFAMKGDREKCLESGATDYIPKPIDSKEFIEKVKYYTQIGITAQI